MTQFCCYLSGFISGFSINYFYRKCIIKKTDRVNTIDNEFIIHQPTFQDYFDNTQNIQPQIAQPCRRNSQIPMANATITD